MNFNNMPVGRKLWAIILGLMLAMLALTFGLVTYLSHVEAETARIVQANEDRISLALRWKGMTELAVERVVRGHRPVDATLKTLDAETDKILEKRRELMHGAP